MMGKWRGELNYHTSYCGVMINGHDAHNLYAMSR
ncbi:hypothetical protein HMPREF9431_02048 [Segatella oulorum F0390]|uniref:Uncharacterized protein n=1 Tax=Segatella oulorum F0390 TaxID=702438 RepID=G1WDZ7_9BACT|nr:hypothetical protein HMPREF9431_02048 [Segatella oulorum F0390]